MKLRNQSAIVTGAASGIGRAIALLLASEGAHVVIADLNETPREGGPPTSSLDLPPDSGSLRFDKLDVTQSQDLERVIAGVVSRHGRLDIMVNNAAIGIGAALLETSEEDWDRVMAVNIKGVFLGCKHAVRQMLTQDIVDEARGRIVNISSQHGMIASPNDIAYGVGKAGVVYMTRQIAHDYAKDHIVCNAVAPGKIVTGKTGPAASAEAIAYSKARTPMPRLGRPLDVARAVLFLASADASFITGENLMVDGGWMAG